MTTSSDVSTIRKPVRPRLRLLKLFGSTASKAAERKPRDHFGESMITLFRAGRGGAA
jgi:hypothetical protein